MSRRVAKVRKDDLSGIDEKTKGDKLVKYTATLNKAKKDLETAMREGDKKRVGRIQEIIANIQITISRL